MLGASQSDARVCIVGAGAMGGLLGAGFLEAGTRVTFVDRGARLHHLQSQGLTLVGADGARRTYRDFDAVDDRHGGGEYDVVFLAVKTYDLPEVATWLPGILSPHTMVVTLQNGIPWWYFHGFGGEFDGRSLTSVDPDGSLAANVNPAQVIGCIPYPAAELLPTGEVRHVEGNKFPVGELDGSSSERVLRLAALLEGAGFRARVLDDVRSETWLKAWGNLAFNPISALTGATLRQICRFEPTRRLAADMMREARDVATALGATFRVDIERRIQGGEAVGDHKTSMLQDLELGRRLETAALVGAVLELAELQGIETPAIRAVYSSVCLLEATLRDAGKQLGAASEPELRPMLAVPEARA